MNPIEALDNARAKPRVRRTAQIGLVVLLVIAAYSISAVVNRKDSSLAEVSGMFAKACTAADFNEIRAKRLTEECRLAADGDLVKNLPADADPDPDAKPDQVKTDVVKDDPNTTPADLTSTVDRGQIEAVVRDYFQSANIGISGAYARAIQRAVARYLTVNPPKPGPAPTRAQVLSATRAILLANPPKDGVDGNTGATGEPGRGIATTSTDGCDVVFTFTDGTTQRVGPLCGPAPTQTQIEQAVAAYCNANGECRGPAGVVKVVDDCNPNTGFVTDVGQSYDPDTQTITLTCTSGVIP